MIAPTPVEVSRQNIEYNGTLQLAHLPDGCYKLTVGFVGPNTQAEVYEFIFRAISQNILNSEYAQYLSDINREEPRYILDAYPLNGIYASNPAKSFFSDDEFKKIEKVNTYAEPFSKIGLSLFVLDVRDKKNKYSNGDEIKRCEERFIKFLRNPIKPGKSSKNKSLKIFRSLNISYMIAEGRLKADLLKHSFKGPITEYLEGTGGAFFCQVGEIVMNAFKKGYWLDLNNHQYHPESYFFNVKETKKNAQPLPCVELDSAKALNSLRRLPLITLYPGDYRDKFTDTGIYYLTLIKFFKTTHVYDEESTVTKITIE